MNFAEQFKHWLQHSLAIDVPRDVEAFSFNLFELGPGFGDKFDTELIGAKVFDPTDSDWACEEIWQPEPRRLRMQKGFSGEDWEQCLDRMKTLILSILAENSRIAEILKSRQGIGIGFVDGDLDVIWQRGK